MTPTLSQVVLAVHFAQAMLIGAVLYAFNKHFDRDPLHYWAWSWTSLALYYLSLELPLVVSLGPTTRQAITIVGAVVVFSSILWLVLGTRQFVGLPVGRFGLWNAAFFGLALAAVFLPRLSDSPILQGDGFWMARCLVAALAYLLSGWLLLRRGGASSVGRYLVVGAFFLYGLQLIHYFLRSGASWWSGAEERSSVAAWSAIDIWLQAIMGLGTVVWLLEREHRFRLRASHKLQQLAFFDAVTRLPNRELFEERTTSTLRQADQSGDTLSILLIDPDRFARINDLFGHAAGDEVLRRLANRLESKLDPGDSLARLEGDLFAIMVPNLGRQEAPQRGTELLERLRDPLLLDDSQAFLTASAGLATYPEDGSTTAELLRNARLALERAKQAGGDQLRCFAPELSTDAAHRQSFEASFRQALAEDEFELFYQPVHRLSDGRLVAAEALIRWNHPTAGLLAPGKFLREAERAGLSGQIVPWTLDQACRNAAHWQRVHPDLRVAVNIDAQTFQRPDLCDLVLATVDRYSLRPRDLELELTESLAVRDPDFGLAMIRNIRRLGVRVALDDFGTGFSSLGYLRDFPIDTLKIDRSFIRELGKNTGANAIVEAIITLGNRLELGLVAEGVETEAQRATIARLGCQLAQGFLFAPPLPQSEFETLLDAEPPQSQSA